MKKIFLIGFSILFISACTNQINKPDSDDIPNNYSNSMVEASQINIQLGLGYLQQGQTPRAKQKLLLALQQNPNSIAALDALGYFWEMTGNNDLANKYYQEAVSKEPRSGQALNNYGAYLCRTKQYVLAEKYLLAAANDPTYINSAAAMENAGLCELAVPNQAIAKSYFKKALIQDPHLATSYYELARINYYQGNFGIAKQYLKSYNSLNGMSAAALWLGILIANKTKDVATVRQNGALLSKHFTKSLEYQHYQQMQKS